VRGLMMLVMLPSLTSLTSLTMLMVTACCVGVGGLSLPSPARPHLALRETAPARVAGERSGSVLLTCSATGSPAPRVAWYKDSLFVSHLEDLEEQLEGSLGETVAQLRLSCLTEADVGQYECRAVSGRHQVSALTQLSLKEGQAELCTQTGRPEISVWSPTIMVEEGNTVTLPCRLSRPRDNMATTTTTITWTNSRGEEVGAVATRWRVTQSGDLEISAVTWSDMGQYTCTASNTAGTASIQTFLYPLASPPQQ